MKKILLVGYSGYGNYGDDLLMFQAYEQLRPYYELTIHTTNTNAFSDYIRMMCPDARLLKSSKIPFKDKLHYKNIVYFGGGIFFEYERTYSLLDKLKKKAQIWKNFHLPHMLGVRYYGVGIGLGPFETSTAEKNYAAIVSQFSFLAVRDQWSVDFMKTHSVKIPVLLTPDLSLSQASHIRNIAEAKKTSGDRVIICIRKYPHGKSKDRYIMELLKACSALKDKGFKLLVYAFQPNHDEAVLDVFEANGYETKLWNPERMTLDDVLKDFASAHRLITSRMHGLYIAAMAGVPSVGIGVHQKIKFASILFKEWTAAVDDSVTEGELLEALAELRAPDAVLLDPLKEQEEKALDAYRKLRFWIDKE